MTFELDTCARCPARAMVFTTKDDLKLNWCRHHGLKYMSAQESQGWSVVFDTASIEGLISTGYPVPV